MVRAPPEISQRRIFQICPATHEIPYLERYEAGIRVDFILVATTFGEVACVRFPLC